MSKLHKIGPLKSYMEATTTGRVDQLWTKEKCSCHSQHMLGKVKTAGQGCGLRASSGGSLECQLKPWDSQHIVARHMSAVLIWTKFRQDFALRVDDSPKSKK